MEIVVTHSEREYVLMKNIERRKRMLTLIAATVMCVSVTAVLLYLTFWY